MRIDAMLVEQKGDTANIVGFAGANLECEGCGDKCEEIFETDDSVFLCKPCFEVCCEVALEEESQGPEQI